MDLRDTLDRISEPWAWAVVDPNGRLMSVGGDYVERLICWEEESAQHHLDIAIESAPEGQPQPYIVPLFPEPLFNGAVK